MARSLKIEPTILEEGILKQEEYLQTFDSFFIKGGKRAIVICFQPTSPLLFGKETLFKFKINIHLLNII